MAWTVVKQALFGMSVFAVVTKGQQQQQGYFFSLMNFKPSLKPVHYISNGMPRPTFSSVLLPAWVKGEEGVFLFSWQWNSRVDLPFDAFKIYSVLQWDIGLVSLEIISTFIVMGTVYSCWNWNAEMALLWKYIACYSKKILFSGRTICTIITENKRSVNSSRKSGWLCWIV